MTVLQRAAEITLAAYALLEAARPIAAVLPCSMVSREQLERLAVVVANMDAVLASPSAALRAESYQDAVAQNAPKPEDDRFRDWDEVRS